MQYMYMLSNTCICYTIQVHAIQYTEKIFDIEWGYALLLVLSTQRTRRDFLNNPEVDNP
jgi:hypothetical protein